VTASPAASVNSEGVAAKRRKNAPPRTAGGRLRLSSDPESAHPFIKRPAPAPRDMPASPVFPARAPIPPFGTTFAEPVPVRLRARRRASPRQGCLSGGGRRPFLFGHREGSGVNKTEQLKAERMAWTSAPISALRELGWEAIEEGDLDRLKWWGVFFRRHTPATSCFGSGSPTDLQRAHSGRSPHHTRGRGIADITTRSRSSCRWIRSRRPGDSRRAPRGRARDAQTGMDTSATSSAARWPGSRATSSSDASAVARAFTAVFVGDQAFNELPRKFKRHHHGCRENCTHAETQDVALVRPRPRSREGGSRASTCWWAGRTALAATALPPRSTSSCAPRRRLSSAAPSSPLPRPWLAPTPQQVRFAFLSRSGARPESARARSAHRRALEPAGTDERLPKRLTT